MSNTIEFTTKKLSDGRFCTVGIFLNENIGRFCSAVESGKTQLESKNKAKKRINKQARIKGWI